LIERSISAPKKLKAEEKSLDYHLLASIRRVLSNAYRSLFLKARYFLGGGGGRLIKNTKTGDLHSYGKITRISTYEDRLDIERDGVKI